MKKILKNSLSLFLAVTIVLGSGFAGFREFASDGLFTIKTKAAGESSLTFLLNEDGDAYFVSGCSDETCEELEIPREYNDMPVTGVSENAFVDCTNLTTITIPNSVLFIGSGAFSSCTNLETVYYKSSKDMWDTMDIGSDNQCLTNAAIIYQYAVIGDLNFELNEDCASYSVTRCKETATGEVVVPSSCHNMPVTKLANNAFHNCENVTSVIIPDSVESIGNSVFANCTSLKSIDIPDSVLSIGDYVFLNCSSLEEITIPDSVTSLGDIKIASSVFYNDESNWVDGVLYIGNHLIKAKTAINGECSVKSGTRTIAAKAFENCSDITDVSIPRSLVSVGQSAFTNCTSIENVNYESTQSAWNKIVIYADNDCLVNANIVCVPLADTSYLRYSLNEDKASYSVGCRMPAVGEIIIPNSFKGLPVTAINYLGFANCGKLTHVTIPDTVTEIGIEAFQSCDSLKSIEIPDSVVSIGQSAFSGCDNLTTVTLPKNVKEIEKSTFAGCLNLTSITIPYGVNKIADRAFINCLRLETLSIPDSVLSIGSFAFTDCEKLKSVFIPSSVVTINDHAFDSCKSLESVILSEGVKTVGSHAFAYCDSLTSIEIPESVNRISNGIFLCCPNLLFLTLPNTIEKIEMNAFQGCQSICHVLYKGTEEEWRNINVDDYSYIRYLNEANPHFCATGNEIVFTEKVAKTCTTDGTVSFTCSICSSTKDVTISSAGHYGMYDYEIPPTCTEPGLSSGEHCLFCGEITRTQTVIEPTGHEYARNWTIDVKATCTTDGSQSHHCLHCSDRIDVTVIKAKGHQYYLQDSLSAHPHTKTYKCQYCVDERTENCTVSDCVECNFRITEMDSSAYKLVSYFGNGTEIVIPSMYNGKSVLTIGNSCFKGNTEITSVEIANGVTSIGSIAFMNCSSLQKVIIPESVTSIGTQAFYGFNGTIYCRNGSTAHNYAIANNIDYVIVGFLDSDRVDVDYENFIIRTTVENCEDITNLLGVSVSVTAVATASYVHGNTELLGTGTIITVFNGDEFIGDFTLIVDGDTNGDSVCDVLDAAQVARASNGNNALEGAYAMAADSNSDSMIDVNDYQAIVNKVVHQ